jgi:hypothetical protein
VFNGKEILEIFTDDRLGQREVPAYEPVLYWTPFGIANRLDPVHPSGFVGVLRHKDDFLEACAIAGLSLDETLAVGDKPGALLDCLNCSIATFDAAAELEWTVTALAHYRPTLQPWRNHFGQEFTFDTCVQLLAHQSRDHAACYATHIPYALCTLLRIDEKCDCLSSLSRLTCETYLKSLAESLESGQTAEGHWPVWWWRGSKHQPKSDAFDQITVTGHHLEWISLAPTHLRPSRRSIADAVNSTMSVMRAASRFELDELYAPVTHFARALCLTVGQSPDAAFRNRKIGDAR